MESKSNLSLMPVVNLTIVLLFPFMIRGYVTVSTVCMPEACCPHNAIFPVYSQSSIQACVAI
uniref:Predicted protein n=1 Tax=Hordeum vulgare subsp. vulgare TaxID=112509 RepID=F2EBA2_HORVV|nr:predicted protein [Hordeum vulgare subsp. vulgare]